MKDKIEQVLIKVDEGTMPVQQALSELLVIFSVMQAEGLDGAGAKSVCEGCKCEKLDDGYSYCDNCLAAYYKGLSNT